MIANPIPWPNGARCAVAMTWDMDADSAFNWYNQQTADNLVAAQSWTRYDPLIAIPRLVEQFALRDNEEERNGPPPPGPAKSRISNRCRRAWRATPSSNRRSRSAAASAARCASIVASSTPAR
jgi:hypothetical protein